MKLKPILTSLATFGAIITVGSTAKLDAATYTWQISGATNIWSVGGADQNWFIDAGTTLSQWADSNAAVFGDATGETVTISGTVSPSGTTFNNNGNWTLNHAAGTLTGAGLLTKNGTGTLTLAGDAANAYSGGTVISGGILSYGTGGTGANTSNVGALGAGQITINENAALRLWIQNSNTHTYTNSLLIDGGTVESRDGINVLSGNVSLGTKGATFTSQYNNKSLSVNSAISGNGPVNYALGALAGTYSTINVGGPGTNTYTGVTTIKSGALVKAGKATAFGAGGAGNETYVQAGGTLDIGGASMNGGATPEMFYIAGTGIANAGALVNTGAGQLNALNNLTLTADATANINNRVDLRNATGAPAPYLDLAGNTLTKAGTAEFYVVNASGGISDGNIIVNSGIFGLEGSTSATLGTGKITVNNTSTLALYNRTGGTFARGIEMNGGTMLGQTAANNLDSVVNIASNSIVSVNAAGNLNLRGDLTGAVGTVLNKNGAGNLILDTAAKTFAGTLSVSAGSLNINATLRNIENLSVNTGGIANVNVVNMMSGGHDAGVAANHKITVDGGTLNLVGEGRYGNIDLMNGGVINVNRATATYEHYLGRLADGSDSVVSVSGTTASSIGYTTGMAGQLWLGQNTQFAISDTASGGADLTVSAILENRDAGTAHVSGFTKTGAGKMLLTGTNTYTGATNVSAGTLQVGQGGVGSISTSVVTVSDSARLTGGGFIAGNVSVNTNGIFNPGDNAATRLTLGGGATLGSGASFEISTAFSAGGAVATEVTSGSFNLTNAFLTGSYAGFVGEAPSITDVLWLVYNSGSGTLDGTFANGTESTAWATALGASRADLVNVNGQDLVVVYNADYGNSFSGGNDLAVFAIPEPGGILLLSLGAFSMLLRRRSA